MKNLSQKSKLMLAFVSGALFVGLLQVSPLKASTSSLSGTCVGIGNYSVWGWPNSTGTTKEYSELNMLNFDNNTAYGIVNSVKLISGQEPTYTQGALETSKFNVDAGPIIGTYKLTFTGADGVGTGSTDYVLAAPANGGNTIFIMDTRSGMTGVCQKS